MEELFNTIEVPTEEPAAPIDAPIDEPTEEPAAPIDAPIDEPTEEPAAPIDAPIDEPTEEPAAPIDAPIDEPTEEPAAPIDNGYITVSRYRRSFKVPPKPRLHANAISPGDAIKASTVRPNERLSVLSSLNIQQEENMEPLPEFSRDMRHANRRYQKAVKDAQEEAEKAKKTKQGENEE